MNASARKSMGAYYTPEEVVRSLVKWVVRSRSDRLLDPACGDGRFLIVHPNSAGVEQDAAAARIVHGRAPGSLLHQGDFFAWATHTRERFDCAAGNPPFIRYQRFSGEVREAALSLCAKHGVKLSSLCSSWAPFLVATSTLLKPGGRLAFVVPAEIGHAPYAIPVLEYLAAHFGKVQIVAVQERIFADLSEDCWLLYASDFGSSTRHLLLSPMTQFGFMPTPPARAMNVRVDLDEWRRWNCRLRPFLMGSDARGVYRLVSEHRASRRLGDMARVGIGYVTGANDFFHLRPSEAKAWNIPQQFLQPAVRNGRALRCKSITSSTVQAWRRRDEPMLLLRLRRNDRVPSCVRAYLDSPKGQAARTAYKCRNRNPWYAVPDVTVPDAFLTYMSGKGPALVPNRANCAGSNSVHVVRLKGELSAAELGRRWTADVTRLSCEIEGHPLGGGMLKLEPREAARVVLPGRPLRSRQEKRIVSDAIDAMRRWRHYG